MRLQRRSFLRAVIAAAVPTLATCVGCARDGAPKVDARTRPVAAAGPPPEAATGANPWPNIICVGTPVLASDPFEQAFAHASGMFLSERYNLRDVEYREMPQDIRARRQWTVIDELCQAEDAKILESLGVPPELMAGALRVESMDAMSHRRSLCDHTS